MFALLMLLGLCTVKSCKALEEFDCKPKEGCHFTTCDPSALDIASELKRNEYPITCQPKKKENEGNNNLIDLYLANLKTITALLKRVDTYEEELKSIKDVMGTLREQNGNLRSELTQLQKCNCVSAEARGQRDTSAGGTKASENAGLCRIRTKNHCFWIAKMINGASFREGAKACSDSDSTVATIDTIDLYRAVLAYMKILTSGKAWKAWIGHTYDPLTGAYTPYGYLKWSRRSFGRSNAALRGVLMTWNSDSDHGMRNADPALKESEWIVCTFSHA